MTDSRAKEIESNLAAELVGNIEFLYAVHK
jgi:hypothetical protein